MNEKTTKVSVSQRSHTQHQCSVCRQVFHKIAAFMAHQDEPYIWSCSIIAGPEAVFLGSKESPLADVCGFCGEEFQKSREAD